MKKVLFVLFTLCLFIGAQAQVKLSAGGALALPMGDMADGVSTGFGVFAQGDMSVAGYNAYGQLGYLSFAGKEVGNAKTSWGIVPVTVGIKYPVKPNIYALAGVGMNFASIKTEVTSSTFMGVTIPGSTTTVSESKFGWLIGAGYSMDKFDFTVNYQDLGWTGTGLLRLNVAYAITKL